MPIYEYEHLEKPCIRVLTQCPTCEGRVRKLISCISISTPKTNSELRDLGFTKLVKRDDGVYENITARNKESRLVIRDKPETLPDLKKTIRD